MDKQVHLHRFFFEGEVFLFPLGSAEAGLGMAVKDIGQAFPGKSAAMGTVEAGFLGGAAFKASARSQVSLALPLS
jgi:hypothetical protein